MGYRFVFDIDCYRISSSSNVECSLFDIPYDVK
jgi:hypothetical protein